MTRREHVLKILDKSAIPLTTEQIAKRIELPITKTYSILRAMRERGEIQSRQSKDDPVCFEWAFNFEDKEG